MQGLKRPGSNSFPMVGPTNARFTRDTIVPPALECDLQFGVYIQPPRCGIVLIYFAAR
jgi:hypothetical protein